MNHDPKRPTNRPDAFLEARDPVERSALSGDGIESALDEIGAEITSRSRKASPRRTRRLSISKPRTALVIGFATIGIGAAVAGGSQLSAHTGELMPKDEWGPGGPGEILNPSAPDFEKVGLQISSDIPFPKAYEQWRGAVIADSSDSETDVRESSGALRGWIAMSAFCAWVLDWRYADIAGNNDAAAVDAKVISAAPEWEAVKAEDPHPDPNALGDSNGSSRFSLFGWMLPFRDAVLSGDSAQVTHLLITEEHEGRCQDYDMDWRALYSTHRSEWRTLSTMSELQQKYSQFLASRTSGASRPSTRDRPSNGSIATRAPTCSPTYCVALETPRTLRTCSPRPT